MPGSAPVSLGCAATARPPRLTPTSGSASAGAAIGSAYEPSSWAIVAWRTRTGTAAATSCVTLIRSLAPTASADASQVMLNASAGTSTGQTISFAWPAPTTTSCAGSAARAKRAISPPATPGRFAVPCSVARIFISRDVVLRSVSIAVNWSFSRTSGGKPESTCRSCVTRMLVLPVPNFCTSASATATRRKLVSESLSGTSIVASPLASRTTLGFQTSKVSNSSRVAPRPPPPPAATALRP